MATQLYLDTTNPRASLFNPKTMGGIAISIIVHTIIYTMFFNMISYIFTGRLLSEKINKRIVVALVLIMFFGFLGRHYRAKDAYNAFGNELRTREFMDHGYVSWMFFS